MRFFLKNKLLVGSILIILLIVIGMVCLKQYNLYRFHVEKDNRLMMSTYFAMYLVGPKKITAPAMKLAFKRIEEIDAKFSVQNSKSLLYAFNHMGEPISDPEILYVISSALEISKKTNGAFDITICPLIETWGFYTNTPHLPKKEEILQSMSHIGYKYLNINHGILEKTRPDIRIDLGGIAKHYAIGEAAKVLKNNGVKSALIDAGGDIFALGKKGNSPWNVGIRNPRSAELMGYLEVYDMAVFSSGDYERFFIQDGKRYHHIFDPATGYPTVSLSAVTLISPDPFTAMGWPVTVFVLGPQKALSAIKEIPGMEVIMVTASGENFFSPGLKDKLMPISKTELK